MQVDDLVKTIKDATEALQKTEAANEARVTALVEEKLKAALRDHPGFTPERKIQHPEAMPTREEEILASMPKELAFESDSLYIASKLLGSHPKALKGWDRFVQKAGDFKKALDTATAGAGLEWVPTGFSAQLLEQVRLELKIAAMFPTVTMPTPTYQLPVQIGRFKSYKHSEQTADTGQTKIPKGDANSISGRTTFTAQVHATEVLASDELTEDTLFPILPLIQSEIVRTLAEGREDAILNGDTAGSHEDTDVSASDDRRKLWLGLRAIAHDQSYTRDLSTLTLDTGLDVRGDMGKYGINPADLFWATGIKGLIALMKTDQVQTLEKFGPNAVVLKGQMGTFLGSPLMISEWIREDLDSTGLYGSGETKTVIHCVHKNGFANGDRKKGDVKILRELYAESGQIALLARERVDFQPLYPAASNKTAWLGVNVG
jgi:hypothetical protein